MLIGAAIAIILLVVAAYIGSRYDGTDNNDGGTAEESDRAAEVSSVAGKYISEGDVGRGMQHYDEQIQAIGDTDGKQELLVMKARSAMRAEKDGLAVEAAKQADDMGSNNLTKRTLADAYLASGEKDRALILYKELLEIESKYSKETKPMQLGPSLESIIKELES